MKNKNEETKYWQDIHQKILDSSENKDEFKEGEFESFSIVKNRRDFLKIMGFSFTMLPMAACTKGPVRKAIPYLEKNDMVTPGVPSWFATYHDGLPILLKTREGRPIKVEGNDKSTWTEGGANAIAQASLLSLYDSYRLKSPMRYGNKISWDSFSDELKKALDSSKTEKKKTVIVTSNLRSPSRSELIKDLMKEYGNIEHIVYSTDYSDELSKVFDENVYVEYDISKANYVLSIGSDFLGSHKDNVHLSKQYSKKRDQLLNKEFFKHVQVESLLSLTGSNADERMALDQNDLKTFLLMLLAQVSGENNYVQGSKELGQMVSKVYGELIAYKGKSIVMASLNDLDAQSIVYKINQILGNINNTVSIYQSDFVKKFKASKFEELVESLHKKKTDVEVMILVDVNPYYNYYDNNKLFEAFGRVPQKFCFTYADDETSGNCQFVAPVNHQFESWGDYLLSHTEVSVSQPVIVALNDTKQFEDVILKVLGKYESYDQYMKSVWSKYFSADKKLSAALDIFWVDAVQKGIISTSGGSKLITPPNVPYDLDRLRKSIDKDNKINLELYFKSTIGDGRHANNPWLQELPDPITKVTWDNYVVISPKLAKKLNISTGDMVEIVSGTNSIVIPSLVQPGVAENTLGIALGYGRNVSGKVGLNLGRNAYPFIRFDGKNYKLVNSEIKISKINKTYDLALTQTHHSIEGRDIFRETTYKKYSSNPKSGNEGKNHLITMWSEHPKKDQQWAMAIDLNKCNGCSACIVSCNAENNIPVVGREEVLNRREMHWLRLDRYYKGDENNPDVAFQPMTCHHCENAPCETVCPVLATVHSSDGLNQQVYNRCVGTRYCANNCPYKVRRFNWFDYPHTDPNEKMVLNPDVTVRSRGVMEKCSLCIQRIQEAKLNAKKEGRELKDGEIKLACQQSCASDAIVFGDLMDPNSKISQMIKDPRNFTVLEELNIKPRLSYLTKIRNKD